MQCRVEFPLGFLLLLSVHTPEGLLEVSHQEHKPRDPALEGLRQRGKQGEEYEEDSELSTLFEGDREENFFEKRMIFTPSSLGRKQSEQVT